MMTGFYIVISRGNLVKKVIGLNIFQTSVFLLYITMGKVRGGTAPILDDRGSRSTRTPAQRADPHRDRRRRGHHRLALALIVRIREAYGTIEEDEIQAMDGGALMEHHCPACRSSCR